jgi:hypothetical protein
MESSGRINCTQMSAAAYAATGLPEDTVQMRVLDIKVCRAVCRFHFHRAVLSRRFALAGQRPYGDVPY